MSIQTAQDYYEMDIDYFSSATTGEKWTRIRAYRNLLLSDCDKTQISDNPMPETNKKAWRDYRQALRDIPSVYANPDDVIFPTSPG